MLDAPIAKGFNVPMPLFLLSLLLADVQFPPTGWPSLPACASSSAKIDKPCIVPHGLTAKMAKQRLGEREHVWWIDGDRLTMIARPTSEKWILLCCSVQTGLTPIPNSGLAAVTVRVPRLREATLEIGTMPLGVQSMDTYRGPLAETDPARIDVTSATITVVNLPSKALGENRRITIYVPPGTPMGARLPVFYLADGAAQAFAPIAAAAVRDGRAKPTVLVGIDAAPDKKGGAEEEIDPRAQEYLPELGGNELGGRYQRHQRFLIEEVIPYIEAHYPVSRQPKDRAIGGYSNGGVLAFTTAEKHPEVFGNVLGMSAGAKSAVEGADRLKTVRVFAGAGMFEPAFHDRTSKVVTRAQEAGGEARFREVVGGHNQSTWDLIFADGYPWLFPATTK